MTTLQPRGPYSSTELQQLYPQGLQLQLVQVLLRHGERTPVSPRFQNAGLRAYWGYCSEARHMFNATVNGNHEWSPMQWRRRLETFGKDDGPVLAGDRNGVNDMCDLGQLTDVGRHTTFALGHRLRHLYIDQLGYMPQTISDANSFYLRATPIPRALESLQQCFLGFYPHESRTSPFPPPIITTRAASDEQLFPNDANCRRFAQLSRAFGQRTADRWNATTEMEYLNKLIGKWMPEYSKRVAVDSHPRLSGTMDTINSTLAHGELTRLPKEFYDEKARAIIDKISVEEWFSGYHESQEYRSLGIGSLMGDITGRMVASANQNGSKKGIRFGLSGCHDTTLAAVLVSLGAFDKEPWPPYTSHIALELFKKEAGSPAEKGWFASFFGNSGKTSHDERKKTADLTDSEKHTLENHFVRLRYNDKVMKVPGCKAEGKHLEGDESFCTLQAFKEIVDKFTPASWKQACNSNLTESAFPKVIEPAGF